MAAALVACGGGGSSGELARDMSTAAAPGGPENPAPPPPPLLEDDVAAPVDFGTGPVAAAGALTESLKALAADSELAGIYRPARAGRAAYQAGAFGPVFAWPVIPIHLVLLPDGRVLGYGSDDKGAQGARLYYAVWDPDWVRSRPGADASAFRLLSNATGTDIFCNTQLVLPANGQVFMAGGDRSVNGVPNYAIADTNFFDPADDSLRREARSMAYRRWYATAVTNARGEVVVLGGRDDRDAAGTPTRPATRETFATTPEIYVPGNGWRTLPGARSEAAFGGELDSGLYPKAWLAPDGRIFIISNEGYFHALGAGGRGSIVPLNGKLAATEWNRTAVMYAPGKILSIRGRTEMALVDINGAQPVVRRGAPMSTPRRWGFSTLLPDGTVWFNGGSRNGNLLADAVYGSELWNPATGRWTNTASAAKPRLYHGNALLLPNGAVLTGGGGAPGPVRNLNAEVYFPPYFFNPDGSFATQPVIEQVTPRSFGWSERFTLQMDSPAAVEQVVLVRTGSSTHNFSNEQRRMALPFTQNGRILSVKAPARATEMPPGHYLVFALRRNPRAPAGEARLVPSQALIVKLS